MFILDCFQVTVNQIFKIILGSIFYKIIENNYLFDLFVKKNPGNPGLSFILGCGLIYIVPSILWQALPFWPGSHHSIALF